MWQVAGFVIGALGIVLAYVWYVRSHRRAMPACHVVHAPVIGSRGIPGVEVRYRGETVPHVATTGVMFWNAGTATLDGSDVAPADPLRVTHKGLGRILHAELLSSTRAATRCDVGSVVEDGHEVELTFDYLDPGDGLAVNVVHTAKPLDVEVRGSFKGHPDGILRTGRSLTFGGRGHFHASLAWEVRRFLAGAALLTVGIALAVGWPVDLDAPAGVIGGAVGLGGYYLVLGVQSARRRWTYRRYAFPADLDVWTQASE